MTETLSQLAEKYGLLRVYRMSLSAGVAAWGWVHDRMWPIYSTGVLVSVLCMLASAQEKQILADHLYGSNPGFEADREKNLTAARTLFHEESAQGVKQVVWMLPRDDFNREYVERHGKA